MNIRRGVKFSDGTTLTPGDVKYSFDLLKIPTHPQNALWASTGLKSVKVVGNTIVFTFAGKPGYQQFDFYRYNVAIVPRHVFSNYSVTESDDGQSRREPGHRYRPVRVYVRCELTAQTFVWQRRSDWWATKALGLTPAPRYVVDIHNSSNQRGARQLPGREHRSLQQLRTEIGDQGQAQDLLQHGPVSPGCEHDVALPEHDEEAAQRSGVPSRSRVLGQHEPDPRQGLPGPRQQGEPDRPATDLEQVGGQEGRCQVRLLVQHRPRRRRFLPQPATRTRTGTGMSRTRTGPTIASRSSARTDGRTG